MQNNGDFSSEEEVEIKRSKIKESFLHFGLLYRVKKLKWQILLTCVIGLFFALTSFLFVQITGLYGLGVDALSHGVARLSGYLVFSKTSNALAAKYTFVVLFWLVNFLVNIPLFIFAKQKIGKNFALLTFVFMAASSIFGIIIGFIPTSEKWFMFNDPLNEIILSKSSNIVQTTIWTYSGDATKHMTIILYGLMWALIQGIFAAALLILNSSTAGFDILVVWYSREKIKNLGFVYTIFHIVSLIIANFIGTYVPTSITIANNTGLSTMLNVQAWNPQLFFNPSFASSLVMILVNGLIVDIFFPKFKLVKVEIMSNKLEEIQNEIYHIKNRRLATSIITMQGGFSKKEQKTLVTICLYLDASELLEIVRKHDENAFLTIYDIKKADGYIYVSNAKDRKQNKPKR